MDHNLDDSLNLEGAIGVDFDHSEDTVVNQADITLDTSGHDEGIPMEFEHIEEQPMLMDTGNEEIIDFMGDQFTMQEYSIQDDQMTGVSTTVESQDQHVFATQPSASMIDLQFEPQSITVPSSGLIMTEVQMQPKIISVKAALPMVRPIASKKETVVVTKATAPRQVAIAPKPPKLTQANLQKGYQKPTFVPAKQFAIAPKPPKPVTLVANKSFSLVKKVSIASAVQNTAKGNMTLTQIGKQLVMVPSSGSQKIKLMPAGSGMPAVRVLGAADSEQTQLIGKQNISGTSQAAKPVMAKIIVQGQNVDGSNEPAVITKLLPATGAGNTQTVKYMTMHQKTVPISIADNKVLLSSPTKQVGKMAVKKQQVISIKSPTPKLLPAPVLQQGTTTKKVLISANPQNVILKTTAPPKTGQITKTVTAGQRTQLHQINVPGKGIQYIRLVTNPSQTVTKTPPKPATSAPPPKTFVLTDSKGNLIQMTAEKMISGQPPPLVVTSSVNSIKAAEQKLVRIAPVTSKPGQAAMQQARSGQSLLAPRSPAPAPTRAQTQVMFDDVNDMLVNCKRESNLTPTDELQGSEEDGEPMDVRLEETQQRIEEEQDSKAALQALIADTVGGEMQEVEVDYEREQSPQHEDSDSSEAQAQRSDQHPLIVIPSYYDKSDIIVPDDRSIHESRRMSNVVNVEVESYNAYQSPPTSQALSETDMVSTDLGLRPRKACNCTKSQCLKLYCDCFANGEFCNRCNCNNCHNNLQNEELRQKAIRGCLDRNPNAFRPKIGKTKSGGPEIIRRHNKGCNCKRSGCLKNYCECYEAKIACTAICKCVGCRNVEETLERARRRDPAVAREQARDALVRPPPVGQVKQPCSFMTTEVIEAVCQCLLAAAVDTNDEPPEVEHSGSDADPVRDVIEEFARCLQDIISAAHQAAPLSLLDETHA